LLSAGLTNEPAPQATQELVTASTFLPAVQEVQVVAVPEQVTQFALQE
jgi:hypothetical protein